MKDLFDAMNASRKAHREAVADENIHSLLCSGIPIREQGKNVFRVDIERGAVMYYPPSNKWQYRGKVHRGNVLEFKTWLLKEMG